NLPDVSGLEAARQIKARRPETNVLMLTVYDSESYLVDAVHAGAAGYLVKGAPEQLILSSIRAVCQGGAVVQPDLLRRVVQPAAAGIVKHPDLTARETEVLGLLAKGRSNRQIAGELHLAEITVKKHVQSLMAKLGAADRTQAAITALRMRLVE
ncbi:MAG TPA: response regulator transcription factor, partial [Candidatus Xenobia bacterium]